MISGIVLRSKFRRLQVSTLSDRTVLDSVVFPVPYKQMFKIFNVVATKSWFINAPCFDGSRQRGLGYKTPKTGVGEVLTSAVVFGFPLVTKVVVHVFFSAVRVPVRPIQLWGPRSTYAFRGVGR